MDDSQEARRTKKVREARRAIRVDAMKLVSDAVNLIYALDDAAAMEDFAKRLRARASHLDADVKRLKRGKK